MYLLFSFYFKSLKIEIQQSNWRKQEVNIFFQFNFIVKNADFTLQFCCHKINIIFQKITKYILKFHSTGQEADEVSVWRSRSSAKLLQLHCPGVERNVPQILHPVSALQSSAIFTSLEIISGGLSLYLGHVALELDHRSWINIQNVQSLSCLRTLCVNEDENAAPGCLKKTNWHPKKMLLWMNKLKNCLCFHKYRR